MIHTLSIEFFYEACTETEKENIGSASPEKETGVQNELEMFFSAICSLGEC